MRRGVVTVWLTAGVLVLGATAMGVGTGDGPEAQPAVSLEGPRDPGPGDGVDELAGHEPAVVDEPALDVVEVPGSDDPDELDTAIATHLDEAAEADDELAQEIDEATAGEADAGTPGSDDPEGLATVGGETSDPAVLARLHADAAALTERLAETGRRVEAAAESP